MTGCSEDARSHLLSSPTRSTVARPWEGRRWALLLISTIDLVTTLFIHPRRIIGSASSPQSQSPLLGLLGMAFLRPLVCFCIGTSRRWRTAQPWILVAVVATWIAVLWEVNMLVQWRNWDPEQEDQEEAKDRTRRLVLFLFTQTSFAILEYVIYLLYLHLSPPPIPLQHDHGVTQPQTVKNRERAQARRRSHGSHGPAHRNVPQTPTKLRTTTYGSPSAVPPAPGYLYLGFDLRQSDNGFSSDSSSAHSPDRLNIPQATRVDAPSPWGSPLRQGASSSTPRSRRISSSFTHDTVLDRADGEEDASDYASFPDDETPSGNGDETDGTWESDAEDDGTSSISSDEIVDMPPPRSVRSTRSPFTASPLAERGSRKRSGPVPFCGSPSPADRSKNGSSSLAFLGTTNVSESGAASSEEEEEWFSDVEVPGETRLETALSARWMKDRARRCSVAREGLGGLPEERESVEDGYGTF